MSMDLYVSGIRKPDDRFEEMKELWEKAMDNNDDFSDAIQEYFGDDEPCGEGIKVYIPTDYYNNGSGRFGVKFDLKDIPDDIETIIVVYE